MSTYWQIQAGSEGRDYSDFFLKYGMAFVGTNIDRMAEIEVGDIIILKMGQCWIKAAGRVVKKNGIHNGNGDKTWLNCDGWDLPAYCYVDWRAPDISVKTSGLGRGAISRMPQKKHQIIANDILETGTKIHPESDPITKKIDYSEIIEFLAENGLARENLTKTLPHLKSLAQYYYKAPYGGWGNVREHEIRSFLVIPLLLALGWSERQLKIELPCGRDIQKKGKIDIACFPRDYNPDKKEECVAIIETKGFSIGLDFAPDQAINYTKDFPNCKAVIVTNGYCYKIYLIDNKDNFKTTASSYLNLLQPSDRYHLDPKNVGGALDVFKGLLPKSYY